jgi:hypothetical protein
MNRRHSLKLISSLPLLAALPSVALAQAQQGKAKKDKSPAAGKGKNLIDENDSLAKAMQYKHDAAQAPAMRTNKKAFCYNCSKYNVCMSGDDACKPLSKADLAKADAAPCQIFKAKLVAKNGWCLSWQEMS